MTDSPDHVAPPSSLAIHGANGRMGRRIAALAPEHGLTVSAALSRDDDPELGQDLGELAGLGTTGVLLSAGQALPKDTQAVIDVSTPSALDAACVLAESAGAALVVGTTGLTEAHQSRLDQAASVVPVLQATNFSLVVNVLWALAEQAAASLPGYDIEVLESHHNQKVDAPSGTAMTLAHRLCAGSNRDPDASLVFARHGHHAKRNPQDLTVQTLRLGDDPGRHTAYLAGPGERLELTHVSTSRDSYAHGACRAAAWLIGQAPGRYTMAQALGLDG